MFSKECCFDAICKYKLLSTLRTRVNVWVATFYLSRLHTQQDFRGFHSKCLSRDIFKWLLYTTLVETTYLLHGNRLQRNITKGIDYILIVDMNRLHTNVNRMLSPRNRQQIVQQQQLLLSLFFYFVILYSFILFPVTFFIYSFPFFLCIAFSFLFTQCLLLIIIIIVVVGILRWLFYHTSLNLNVH